MQFAPQTFRAERVKVTVQVEEAMLRSNDLKDISPDILLSYPKILETFRMCGCPPIARERLAGLAGIKKTLVERLEAGSLPTRSGKVVLDESLRRIVDILTELLDVELFPWLATGATPTVEERHRASTIVADRLCGSTSNPIIRNAQAQRQLDLISQYLVGKGYVLNHHPSGRPIMDMKPGTFAKDANTFVGDLNKAVKIPIDIVVQPKKPRRSRLPILIEAKSAGDFTNVNKRRKEEARKAQQLRVKYGGGIEYNLFLCGYFNAGDLGYIAADGIDWVWEHRIRDLDKLGL
jgi:hypothetical protein